MKKFAFFSFFFLLFSVVSLNAQSTLCDEICPPGCCAKICDLSQCTPEQIAACKAKIAEANAKTAQATPVAMKQNCDITKCTPAQIAACKAKAVKNNATTAKVSNVAMKKDCDITKCTPEQIANCRAKKGTAVKVAATASSTDKKCCDWLPFISNSCEGKTVKTKTEATCGSKAKVVKMADASMR